MPVLLSQYGLIQAVPLCLLSTRHRDEKEGLPKGNKIETVEKGERGIAITLL